MTTWTSVLTGTYKTKVGPRTTAQPRKAVLAVLLGTLAALLVRLLRARREILTLTGLGFLAGAAWTYGTGAGLAATGLAVLVLEFLMGD